MLSGFRPLTLPTHFKDAFPLPPQVVSNIPLGQRQWVGLNARGVSQQLLFTALGQMPPEEAGMNLAIGVSSLISGRMRERQLSLPSSTFHRGLAHLPHLSQHAKAHGQSARWSALIYASLQVRGLVWNTECPEARGEEVVPFHLMTGGAIPCSLHLP